MIQINGALLEELGLDALPLDERNAMLRHIYDTLELRVGTRLANAMSDDQLTEFETFSDADDSAAARAWLAQEFPDHPTVVAEEFVALKAEIRQVAPRILAESGDARAAD